MKRLLVLALALPAIAFGAMHSLYVGTGTPENALVAGDGYITGDAEVDGVLLLDAIAIPVDDVTPDVAGGNIAVTGVNTVPTALTDLDNPIPGATYTLICGDIANASTIADAGNFTLAGGWNPTAVGDSITLYCRADNDYVEVSRSFVAAGGGPLFGDPFIGAAGLVGTPTYTWLGDLDTGEYWIGANSYGVAAAGANVGTWDATGLAAVGVNAPIGTVTPAQGEFTNIYGDGDFYFGQDPGDLHEGLRRTETIKFVDGFNMGVNVQFALVWDLTGTVGGGTNTVAATPGLNTLTTGGGGAGNTESTLSFTAHHFPAYEPRIECSMAIPVLANTECWFGFYNAANDYVFLEYDASASANWFISADDAGGVGPDTMDTGVAATVAAQKLEITITAAGVVDCAINDGDIDCAALGTGLTVNGHQTYWRVMEEAAGATVIAVDYIEEEQLKMQ